MNTSIFRLLLAFVAATAALTAGATTFQTYQNFPQPAFGSFVVSGTGLPDGRLLLWNGDRLYRQRFAGGDRFDVVASGYQGDTAFVALAPDGQSALLGQGFAGDLYLIDPAAPANYSPASVVANVPGHYAGVYLNDHLVLLDVGRLDFSGSELQIIDLDNAKGGAKALPQTAIAKGGEYFLSGQKDVVVDKPPFGYSAALAIDAAQGVVYAMDANTRELRFFAVADLVNAFNTATPLDWATDGTLVGNVGDYFSGGVSGVRPNGDLVIGGSLGFLQPGGIQVVNPSLGDPQNAFVVETLDPAGTSEFYYALYNQTTDVIAGLTFDGTAYTPVGSIAAVPVAGLAGLGALAVALAALGTRRMRK